MSEILFFFGAGASYGAGDIIPEQPPLGAQLFDSLAKIYPNFWGAFPREIRKEFHNFEKGMEIIHKKYFGLIPILMQQMAIFFIQFRPYSFSSLYCNLIDELIKMKMIEHSIFSTINYECIIEFSLIHHGYKPDYFNNEKSENCVRFLKLHGSCNMFSHNVQVTRQVVFSAGVRFEGGIKAFFDIGTVIGKCLDDSGLPPVMNLYMKGKPLNISHSVIKTIQERWRDSVYNSEIIFCIGANPNPEDNHIWEPLSKCKAKLYYIGNEKSFSDWVKKNRKYESIYLSERFSTGYNHIIRRLREYEFK